MAIGKTLRSLRKKAKLSQEELAEKCNLHRTYIGALERDEKSPTISTLTKIVNALNISMSDFFKRT
ncbi:MAG: helix-turn-helix transcriptional regulator [Candidatus Marinimicrobia bacterium]|nr:helix-turn-helix transcriptional regulator [Candidatus Neomarinimicrobiota bacterium]MBT3675362.1 helix-turn-helix transcriptional regulator [Candidatus Neomarinimicrobiota bacterium]MBT3763455.1 helix-turn-helix transcriptional regulator [Candidatus Neomarinimicrobiota bacterium]MBT4068983.1 helix-turn-helix transcriptional regulator [Candidatus Neomarinimicrobiota bacterium]MBT4372218.1 helix-turn-helix transcriptional regulator [Candidatus Neomarinimicrobiota bacterium]